MNRREAAWSAVPEYRPAIDRPHRTELPAAVRARLLRGRHRWPPDLNLLSWWAL